MDGASHATGAHDLAPAQHPQMPAQPGLADAKRLGELEYRDLRNPGQVLKNPKSGDAGERLVMSPELPQREICEQRGRCHIKNPLWIIARQFVSMAAHTNFPPPRAGEGQGG